MNSRKNKTTPCFLRPAAVIVQTVIFGGLVGVGVAALAVDVGLLASARSELQRTADASALAGASGLMELKAHERAEQFAFSNQVANTALLPADLEIMTGMWSGKDHQFTPTPPTGINGKLPNAVRVVGTRSGLGLFFARALGIHETVARRPATAVLGSGSCAGIWGIEIVTTEGNIVTDSYDSDVGPYGPGNIRPNGDVCSCGDIVAHGSISIRGDAMYGEDHSFIPFGVSYEVLGIIDEHACGIPDVDVDYAYFMANNDNADIPPTFRNRDAFAGNPDHLFVTGNDHLTLPPGTYYFDSVLIDGQAYINVTGPTTMYINGNAYLTGGGLVNTTQVAGNLIIYAAGPLVDLSGNAAFHGAIIAPDATVVARGTFNGYGTVLARVLSVEGNMNFHVDERLVSDLFGRDAVAPILVE